MRRIADLSQEAILTLARMDKPEYIKVKSDPGSPMKYEGPTLGIRPSYDDEEEGLLIGSVVEGRPAAKAGLKADDRIVSIDGKPIKNIQTYMTILGGRKKGDTIEIGLIRNGKKQTVKVKLE